MSPPEKSRREYITLSAIEPKDGKLTCRILISHERMQAVARRSMGQVLECGNIVPMILKKPTAIFEGLRRDDDEDRRGYGWRCYCGVPDRSYRADGTEGPPRPGYVYLVFVNEEGVAYNWSWAKADPDNPRLPVDHETRFRENLL